MRLTTVFLLQHLHRYCIDNMIRDQRITYILFFKRKHALIIPKRKN